MSEKKSWDVARKPAVRVQAPPVTRKEVKPQAIVKDIRPSPRVAPRSNDRLRDRRRKKQRVAVVSAGILLVLVVALGLYIVWRPAFRITSVTVEGPHLEEVRTMAGQTLSGTYAFIIPKNSIYFFPTESLRTSILNAYPDVSAVSITRDSFGSIKIVNLPRASVFHWCGESILAKRGDENCYDTDSEGLVFQPVATMGAPSVPINAATTSATSSVPQLSKKEPGELKLYGALTVNADDPSNPVRAHIAYASRIAPALAFIKALGTLGIPVPTLEISGDEANLYTPSNTRVTYVLGREESALALAQAVVPKLNLTDGSIEYLDLRFSGKAYIKRVGKEAVPQ